MSPEDPQAVRELPDRVEVGWVRRPHGIQGEVLIEVESDTPERFDAGGELVVVVPGKAPQTLRIAAGRFHNKGMLLRFDGVESREEAEALKGARLEVDRSQVPPAPEGTFYYYELVGCRCTDRQLGELGEVVDVVEDGGGLLLITRGVRGELPIPFVQSFIEAIDIARGRIDLDLPAGLLEICGSRS